MQCCWVVLSGCCVAHPVGDWGVLGALSACRLSPLSVLGPVPAHPMHHPQQHAAAHSASASLQCTHGCYEHYLVQVAKFNHTHKVSDIRRFLRAARPDMTVSYAVWRAYSSIQGCTPMASSYQYYKFVKHNVVKVARTCMGNFFLVATQRRS